MEQYDVVDEAKSQDTIPLSIKYWQYLAFRSAFKPLEVN